jgi:hypothetical protein
LSFRAAIGYDAELGPVSQYLDKTQVHRLDSFGYSYLVAELDDGSTFSDQNIGLTVRQIRRTADSVTLQVWTDFQPPDASAVTLTPSLATPATTGAAVTFAAAASGGSGNYEYMFLLRAPGGTLTPVRNYSTTATWIWNTSGLAVGTYQVVVRARNVGSTKSFETYQSLSYALAPPASFVTLTPNLASPSVVGSTVTFSATASGGSGRYEYMFLLRAPGGTLTPVRNYSTTATWAWSTSSLAAGTYQVVVRARNVGSSVTYEAYRVVSHDLRYSGQ